MKYKKIRRKNPQKKEEGKFYAAPVSNFKHTFSPYGA